MNKVTVLQNDPNFDLQDVHCPWCDYVHLLPTNILDDFRCSSCRNRFWIAPLTMISSTPPKVVKDADGNMIAWQLSFGWLSQFVGDDAKNNT